MILLVLLVVKLTESGYEWPRRWFLRLYCNVFTEDMEREWLRCFFARPRYRCMHCGTIEATKRHVQREGAHHFPDCPRFRTGEEEESPVPPRSGDLSCNGGTLCDIHRSGRPITAHLHRSLWSPSERREVESQTTCSISPCRLLFSQDSIAETFRDGSSFFLPLRQHNILACFHECSGVHLFALNNRTLFNALHNNISTVFVTIVDRPRDWHRRFTGKPPWTCVHVRRSVIRNCTSSSVGISGQFVRIPAESVPFPMTPAPSHQRWVLLEVKKLVNPTTDTFYELLNEMCPDLDIKPCEGDKQHVRVWATTEAMPLVQTAVKALAKKVGRQPRTVYCVQVPGMQRFDSPRD